MANITKEEIAIIQQHYLTSTADEISLVLESRGFKRSVKCIQTKIRFFETCSERRAKAREALEKRAKENIHRYRAEALYYAAKSRVKEKETKTGKQVPFNITVDWIEEKLRKGKCELSNVDLNIKEYTSRTSYVPVDPRSASLDQIIPGAGYTKDNVRVVCDCLNKMLSDKSDGIIYDVVSQWITHYEKTNRIQCAVQKHTKSLSLIN